MSGTISVKLITSANPEGQLLNTENAATTISNSEVEAIIEVTFTGTGKTNEWEELTKATIDSGFDAYGLDDTSIGNRTLKVKVVDYNGIWNAFSTMNESSKLNIVDLSGMVANNNPGEGQTQGLDGYAFSGCSNLQEITLFSNCAEIETGAFYDCNNLLKIYEIPLGMSAVTSGINSIFGGIENENTISIFNIALGITGRGVENAAATITYNPENPKTATNVDQIYNVTATAILKNETDHQASTIFSEKVDAATALTQPTIGYKSYSAPQVPNQLEVEVTNDGDAKDDKYSYQWERSSDSGANWTKINDATSATYTFTTDDKGKSFRAVVEFEYTDGTTGSKTLGSRPYIPPTWNTVPNDKKTATVGEEYTYSPTTVGDPQSPTYHLLNGPSWLSLSSGNTLPLTGKPTTAEDPQTVKLAVVEDSVFYMASVLEFTIKVSAALTPPTIDYKTITVPNDPNQLKVEVTDTGDASDFTYQWERSSDNGASWTKIEGATSATYTFTTDDNVKSFRAVVGFTYDDGTTGSETLKSKYYILSIWNTVPDDKKTATVGQEYIFNPTNDAPDPTYYLLESPSWLSLSSSDSSRLTGTPTTNDIVDPPQTVKIALVDGGMLHSASFLTFTIKVSKALKRPKIVYETITVPNDPNQLKVEVSDDDDVSSFTYQWQRSSDDVSWTDIGNATSETYTFTTNDLGKYVKVVVSFTYTDGTTGSETLGSKYYILSPWDNISEQTATVGQTYIFNPTNDAPAPTYYLLESPGWLNLLSDKTLPLTGTPKVADIGKSQTVKIALVDDNILHSASFLTFKITVLPFKPATKTALQTAIDKWYELANGRQGTTSSTTTSSTSQTGRINSYKTNATHEVGEKTKFYITRIDSDPIELDIEEELTKDSYLNAGQGITLENLVKVEIGSKVTSIGREAFRSCRKLQSVTIPDSVTSIGDYAFYYCTELPSVTIPDSVTSFGQYAFSRCEKLQSVTIPDSVTSIPNFAFQSCLALQSVTIGDSVTRIGRLAFQNCNQLQSVTIGNSVETIGDYAFRDCLVLQSLTIPDSVKTIGENAFEKSGISTLYMTENNGLNFSEGSLTVGGKTVDVIFVSSTTKFYINSIDSTPKELDIEGELTKDSYENKQGITRKNLVKVEIGSKVTSIGDNAFDECNSLQSVIIIGDSVKTIGRSSFGNCSKLQSMTIPDSVTSIVFQAFANCSNLQSLIIGNSVETIGGGAFTNCSALQNVTIPDSVSSIGNYAFAGCNALKSVTLPDRITSIGMSVFSGCSALPSLTIPDSVTSIGQYAFYFCKALQSLTIPDSVTSIGNFAFGNCQKLELLTLPINDQFTSISQGTFQGCSSLKSVIIPDSVETIGSVVFSPSAIQTLYMSENNGLELEEGSLTVDGGKTVNVIFFSKDAANNYDGPEYFGNPNAWDVSLITDLSYVFFMKDQENHPDISTWDVSNVTSLQGTFSNSTFNGKLINWNVVNVSDFSFTFANNVVFNQPLERWNIQDATTMESMFDNAYLFNQKIEPPMVQYKDGTDFPTQLTWDEDKVNGYLETIYGSATPQTDPTTFKGVFGMIALLKKTYLDALDGITYKTIKLTFSEIMSKLITNQQEILEYNYTYDRTEKTWKKPEESIYSANTKDKSGDDLKEARDKLNKLRLNTIVDGMLLINRAYDMAKSLAKEDLSFYILVSDMKNIYDDVYANLPFYVAWYACHGLTTKASFLNNALTFHNGATTEADDDAATEADDTAATIDPKLTSFIATNPIKSINDKRRNDTNDSYSSDKTFVQFSSLDLYNNFKTAYKL